MKVKVALDACLSRRLVPVLDSLYGRFGYEFRYVDDILPASAKDIFWADAFKKFGGKFVISGDPKIAYRPHEAIAFIDNGFVSFFPDKGWGRLKGHGQAAFLVHQWALIMERIDEFPAGTCWRMPCVAKGDEVRLSKAPLERLEIPDDVLEKARQERKRA